MIKYYNILDYWRILMRIKNEMINRELRKKGRIMRYVPGFFKGRRLKLLSKLTNKYHGKVKSETMKCSENWIMRKDGSKLRICIFSALEKQNNLPGIMWIHGGGYAIGAPELSAAIISRLIEIKNCVVVSPDYRLSIDAPYPAALDDCYDTLLWMKANSQALGIRNDQLMVGGESAGGGLTAALTLYARDRGEVAVAFQMPLYPMLDDKMENSSAVNNDAPVWNSNSNYASWKIYLGDLFGTPDVPCYAAPARAENYCNLPPTTTFVGDLEPFRDEVIEYVENLRKAGVPVEFKLYKGCYHAFEQMCPKAEISKDAVEFILNSFKYAAENYYAAQSN